GEGAEAPVLPLLLPDRSAGEYVSKNSHQDSSTRFLSFLYWEYSSSMSHSFPPKISAADVESWGACWDTRGSPSSERCACWMGTTSLGEECAQNRKNLAFRDICVVQQALSGAPVQAWANNQSAAPLRSMCRGCARTTAQRERRPRPTALAPRRSLAPPVGGTRGGLRPARSTSDRLVYLRRADVRRRRDAQT